MILAELNRVIRYLDEAKIQGTSGNIDEALRILEAERERISDVRTVSLAPVGPSLWYCTGDPVPLLVRLDREEQTFGLDDRERALCMALMTYVEGRFESEVLS